MTLSEAAFLAGLLKAPSTYAPTASKDRAIKRAQVVLTNMRSAGFISEEEQFVAGQMMRMPRASTETFETAPYILDFVAEILPDVIGEARGDLVVETYLDLEMQARAEEIAAKFIAESGEQMRAEQAGIVLMTNDGIGQGAGRRARLSGQPVQPGPPRACASRARHSRYSSISPRSNTASRRGRADRPAGPDCEWEPKNYGNSYRGAVTIDEALTRSINTVAAQVADEIGTYAVIDVAHRLGILQDLPNQPSLALGTGEVTLYELTGAFANLAMAASGSGPISSRGCCLPTDACSTSATRSSTRRS